MKKDASGKYVKRESGTGRFVVKKDTVSGVVVTAPGVSVKGTSARRAKTAAKSFLRYSTNMGFFINNDRNEATSAISIAEKPKSFLEQKYRDVGSEK